MAIGHRFISLLLVAILFESWCNFILSVARAYMIELRSVYLQPICAFWIPWIIAHFSTISNCAEVDKTYLNTEVVFGGFFN